ncbi:hypothetical protein KJ641_00835 [Patescibacteria group bacterium]|nr:hypothetical protein [Patescibacteria group bacterium]
MDIKDFTEKSRNYLSRFFSQSSHNLHDQNMFGVIEEPIKLNGVSYLPFFFKPLTGYEPNQKDETPVLYTFFILVPPKNLKENFLHELTKKNSGEAHNENVIGQYYLPVAPGRNDFEELINELTNLLELNLFQGKGYKFSFHLVCPTADYNFALIFVETNSVLKLGEQYVGKVPFDI